MLWYTSHIYAEAKTEVLTLLRSDPATLPGLFYFRELGYYDTRYIVKDGLPKNGLIVIREVCNAKKTDSDFDEVQFHQQRDAPVLSWWSWVGPSNLEVFLPSAIPTMKFGRIFYNHELNPTPPLEFLQYLKHLSISGKANIGFYHFCIAGGDAPAEAEYAWLFGDKELIFVRYIDGYKNVTCFNPVEEPRNILVDSMNERQPILRLVMDYLNVTLRPESYFHPNPENYFSYVDWNNYKVSGT